MPVLDFASPLHHPWAYSNRLGPYLSILHPTACGRTSQTKTACDQQEETVRPTQVYHRMVHLKSVFCLAAIVDYGQTWRSHREGRRLHEECHDVDIVWRPSPYSFTLFSEAAINPLETGDDAQCTKRASQFEKPIKNIAPLCRRAPSLYNLGNRRAKWRHVLRRCRRSNVRRENPDRTV
jgi:hypothetical protein